jgi:tyrosine-protein kinase Etk/Wzc
MSEPMPNHPDLIVQVTRRWRTVLVFVVLGVGAALAYAFLTPVWYAATLTVVPSQRNQDAASSLAAKLPIGIDALSTDVQRIQAVMASASVADEVIAKFRLQERYGTSHIEQARRALAEHCTTGVDRKSSVVSLTCEDKDPQRAMEMAAFFGDVANRVFARISVSSAREERKFLETQVVKARKDVEETSQKLREFQEKHRIIDLPEQSKAVMSAMASLQGEMLSKQLELSYLARFSARNEPSVVQLEQQIAIMENKIKQLADSSPSMLRGTGSGAGSAGPNATFFPDAMSVPALRFELEQLLREQKVRETVFALMTQRYEMARVDEARDTSTFQILDQPTLPTYKNRPNRKKIVVLAFLGSIAAAIGWIRFPVWWRRRVSKVASSSTNA